MIMKFMRTLFLLIGLYCISLVNAQTRNFRYFLYNSEDKVYQKKGDNWEPVIYERTILDDKSIIKTKAPFTLKINSIQKLLFCPESKDGERLDILINSGGKKNKTVSRTHTKAFYDGFSTSYIERKNTINYLILGSEETKTFLNILENRLRNTLRADTDLVLGYNKVLLYENELSKESILKSIKSLSDSIKRGKLILYVSCNGIKDKDGKYYFIPTVFKDDTLNCNLINFLPADTLDTYFSSLESRLKNKIVYIDTNHPIDFLYNVRDMENSCAYVWPISGDDMNNIDSLIKSLLDESFRVKDPGCDVRYYIRKKRQ